jgi:hypothetical protein
VLASASGFRVPDSVLSSDFGSAIVVLSLKNGRYYTLDETASQVWRTVSDSSQYRPEDLAIEAADDVMAGLLRLGLIVDADQGEPDHLLVPSLTRPERALSVPSVTTATAWMSCISVALRTVSLRSVWRWAHGPHACQGTRCSSAFVDELSHQVARASALSPFRCQCLEQSLFVLRWLRRSGIDAGLRLGIMQYPFRAHAWVEVHGTVVNDSPERIRVYRPLGDWQCLPLSPHSNPLNCPTASAH